MSDTVIRVENICKCYRLGFKESRKDTLLGQLAQSMRTPFDNLKRLRNMTRFKDEDESAFWALRDINFEVKHGEVLGIIGHNGAGKSTLLKILSRITEPSSGRITIYGRIAALLEVGTGFHHDLSGRENIYMNGTILGMTRREIDRKLDEIVDFSGVAKHLDTPVKFYSSGMKVRLGFAVAAHLEPEILIIDEVLAVGDAEFQKKCLGKMEDVAAKGRTVLFVSHDMGAVQTLCPRSMLLDKSNISLIGDTSQVINYYLKKNSGNFNEIKFDCSEVSISKVSVNQDNSQSEIKVEIYYSVKIETDNLFVGFSISNVRGNRIFKTYDLLESETTRKSPGNYLAVYTFSSQLLQSGSYYLNLHIMIKNVKWILKESQSLTFEIKQKSQKINVNINAVINPPGKWKITKQ